MLVELLEKEKKHLFNLVNLTAFREIKQQMCRFLINSCWPKFRWSIGIGTTDGYLIPLIILSVDSLIIGRGWWGTYVVRIITVEIRVYKCAQSSGRKLECNLTSCWTCHYCEFKGCMGMSSVFWTHYYLWTSRACKNLQY